MSTEDMSTREIMAELKKIIDAKGMSVEEFFGKMDTDGDGKINGPELSKTMKEAMEGLTFMQVSNIIKDLDSNLDYRIDVQELKEALQNFLNPSEEGTETTTTSNGVAASTTPTSNTTTTPASNVKTTEKVEDAFDELFNS